MNLFWKKIVLRLVYKHRIYKSINELNYTDYKLAKGFKQLKISFYQTLKSVLLVVVGIFSASFGLKGFLLTNRFIDGGVTGISLLLADIFNVPLYVLLIVINLPFIILGYKAIGKQFAINAVLAIAGLSLCVAFVHFPNITDDNLLVALFGGFFLGAGIGLTIRGGAVIDGTEVLAIYLSRSLSATIGDIITVINIIIFSAAAYFLGLEIAMYSMITYLAASKTLDFIVEGLEGFVGVTIISTHNDEIEKMIVMELGRGVTVYAGKKGFGKSGVRADIDILYTVLTRLELNKLKTQIRMIDNNAFVVMDTVKDIMGGRIKKRPLNH